MQNLLIYLCVITVVAVFVTCIDKFAAVKKFYRVPERTLLIIAALGGGAGMYLTMKLIRHKTKKLKFMLGIPLIVVAQVAVILLINSYADYLSKIILF
ncbi:MAG: DUF1294 domain-containing protein [bacterium]|nr:DUF1294 domain-containing protein [bacterium]